MLEGGRRRVIEHQRMLNLLLLLLDGVRDAYACAWLTALVYPTCSSADKKLLQPCEQAPPSQGQLRVDSENVSGTYHLSRERIGSSKQPDATHIIRHCMEFVGAQIEPFDLRPT